MEQLFLRPPPADPGERRVDHRRRAVGARRGIHPVAEPRGHARVGRLIPKPMKLQEFCQDRIRKNTVDRFTQELAAYPSFFEGCYTRAGLDSAGPPSG